MALQQKIDQDLKEAMQARDEVRVSTIRFLKSAIKYSAIEKKTQSLGDPDIQQVIQKQIKQRRESIDQFMGAGRPELAEKERHEAEILEQYLPKQLGDSELEVFVKNEIQASGAISKKDFGRMMKLLNEKLAGKAEAKRISDVLGRLLQ